MSIELERETSVKGAANSRVFFVIEGFKDCRFVCDKDNLEGVEDRLFLLIFCDEFGRRLLDIFLIRRLGSF